MPPKPHDEDDMSTDSSSEQDIAEGPIGGADEDWEDWQGSEEGDDDGEPSHSLFEPSAVLPSPEAAFAYDKKKHGFDVRQYAVQAQLDDYDVLRVINFIRAQVKAGQDPMPALRAHAATPAASRPLAPWADDSFLVPVLEMDALLCYDYEDYMSGAGAGVAGGAEAGPSGTGSTAHHAPMSRQAADDLRALKEENAALREMLRGMQIALMPDELRSDLSVDGAAGPSSSQDPATQAGTSAAATADASAPAVASTSAVQPLPASAVQAAGSGSQQPAQPTGKEAAKREIDDSYFDSYSGFKIHQEMLSDKPRTEAYRDALEGNPSLVRGKRVLDLGCGTGILSMFAARAGAAQVVSVDGSDRIAGFARKIAALNGYSSDAGGPMTVVASRVEQLAQLPGGVEQVDVIVSEWMGYALLFETMLDSVLHARDRWLAPGGVVLPDMAIIYVAGGSEGAQGLGFWKDVYGFKMDPIAEELRTAGRAHAAVLPVDPAHITTSTVTAKVLDLCTMVPEDQDFTSEFVLTGRTDADGSSGSSSSGPAQVASLVLWFDTDFSAARCPERPVKLTTSPFAPTTHWAQTVLPLPEAVLLASPGCSSAAPNTATEISGRISMARNRDKHRSLDIALTYRAVLGDGRVVEHAAVYAMSVLG